MDNNIPPVSSHPAAPPNPAVQTPAGSQQQPKQGRGYSAETKRNIISTVAIIIIAPLIALCVTAFVFQSYEVDGPSMESTLQNNDRLIVYKLPKTWSRLTGHAYIPNRGDIIIFSEKGLDSGNPSQSKVLIKRVIGLPGDRIVIKNNVVTVYNKQHPHGFDPDTTLPYFKGRSVPATTSNQDITVPPNDIFAMGDNRPDSLDSRFFGPVPVKNIIGKLVLRVLPLNKAEKF